MNHSELREMLDAYYDRELPEREACEVEAHLGSCAPCRRELEDWKSFAGALLHPPPPSASEAFVRRVMAKIPDTEGEAPPGFLAWRWLTPVCALAAAAFVLILAWPSGNGVAAETLLLAEEDEEASALLAFAPRGPERDEVLGFVLEEP